VVDHIAEGFEVAGLAALVAGAALAIAVAALRLPREHGRAVYRELRQNLGRAILLGLELLVAADIVRSIARTPTPADVAMLAAIVAIRTFLSFTLEVELEGRWPWQAPREPHGGAGSTT
jgi:uncharacterized membrane protein